MSTCIKKVLEEASDFTKIMSLLDVYDITIYLEGFDDSYGDFSVALSELLSAIGYVVDDNPFLTDSEIVDVIDYGLLITTKSNPHDYFDFRDEILQTIITLLRTKELYDHFKKFLNILMKRKEERVVWQPFLGQFLHRHS